MDDRDTLDRWLQSLTGRQDAAFRADRTYRLLLDKKLAITLFVPEDGSRLMIMADLLRVDDSAAGIFREVAAINLRFDLTGGMTVALEKSSSTLIAFYQYAPDFLDPDSFRRLLAALETRLLKLQETLEALVRDFHPFGTVQASQPAYGALA